MTQCKYSRCQAEAMPGYRFCRVHHERNLEYGRRRRAALRAMGKCPLCGGELAKGRKYCLYCLGKAAEANARAYPRRAEKARAYARQRRERNKAAGLCACGKPRAPGRASCPDCLRRHVRTMARRRQRRFEAGLCIVCGKHPALPGLKIGACCRKVVQVRKPRPYVPMSRNHLWYRQFEAAMVRARWKREHPQSKGA